MSLQPPSKSTSEESGHNHRRIFIGPLPEKFIIQQERLSVESEGFLTETFRRNAFRFFLRKGGKEEDYRESEEQSLVDEMMSRWRESEWGRFWRRRQESKDIHQTTRWVGGTFEIGKVVEGVSLMEEFPIMSPSQISLARTSPSNNMERFTSARSDFALSSTDSTDPAIHASPRLEDSKLLTPATIQYTTNSPNSSTALLRPSLGHRKDAPQSKARTDTIRRPIIKFPSFGAKSDTHLNAISLHKSKGKGKSVRYDEMANTSREDPVPASPTDVLRRTGSATEETSAGATVRSVLRVGSGSSQADDVIMSDRILVRVSYTKFGVGPTFDEVENRITGHLEYEAFKEFMVVWRNNRVELYDDYNFPRRALVTDHKHMAFLIPLESPTHLSLYSFVDLTFCLTCQPTSTRTASPKSRWFSRDKEGMNVFIFKVKSRSRAVDWVWRLWRHLGGKIPSVLEVRNPALDTRVRVQVPTLEFESTNVFKMFSRRNIIELVRASLQSEPHWKYLVESQLERGMTLELAWRNGTTLDWVWLEEDVTGKERDWAVLCGLAFQQSTQISRLEVRLADHASALLRLSNGERIPEPPAVEGYVDRIKPTSATKQKVYLATHNGYLFLLSPTHAHPPTPPGLQEVGKGLRRSEVIRGAMQITEANGVCDVRNIVAIRRAFQLAIPSLHDDINTASPVDDNHINVWAQDEGDASDDEDIGGDDPLNKAEDKPRFRMKRSFELLIRNGNVVRFEAYSRRGAVEWIQNLRALIFYWRHRHRQDAREEMTIAQATRNPITPRIPAHYRHGYERPPEAPVDENDPMPSLSSSYNWCVLDGCRSILRGGKIFMRRGLYGRFKLIQLYLVGGHLIWFRITPKSSLNQRAKKGISLTDAYVGSGYFVAMILPQGQYKPDNNLPRRYQDGLEADDPEEDTMFAVWYYSKADAASVDDSVAGQDVGVPLLSASRKVTIFRTRSKVERDTWCWAINCEIEKLVRAQKEREGRLREVEGVIQQ